MNKIRIDLLKKYISEESDNPFNSYALAMEYYTESPTESLKLLETLRRDHSDYLPTYFKLAHLYWDHEEWEQAESIFKAGIEVAERQKDQKALSELRSAFQNFQFDH